MNKGNVKTSLDDLDENEMARATIAREAYIRWRCQDIPVPYISMLPKTANLKTLWIAEKCLRKQTEADFAIVKSPWRPVGPSSPLFAMDDLTAQEKLKFGLEIDIPIGLDAAVKAGRWNDPEVLAAMERAKETPAHNAAMDLVAACEAERGAASAYSEGMASTDDVAQQEKLKSDLDAATARTRELRLAL